MTDSGEMEFPETRPGLPDADRKVFFAITGHDPTPEDTYKYVCMKNALRVRDGDPLFAYIVAMDYYGRLATKIPERIDAVISRFEDDKKEDIQSNLVALNQTTEKKLLDAIRGIRVDMGNAPSVPPETTVDTSRTAWDVVLLTLGASITLMAIAFFLGVAVGTGNYPAWAGPSRIPVVSSLFWAPTGFVLCPVVLAGTLLVIKKDFKKALEGTASYRQYASVCFSVLIFAATLSFCVSAVLI